MKNIINAKSKFKLKLWGKWFNFRLYKRKSFLFFFLFFVILPAGKPLFLVV